MIEQLAVPAANQAALMFAANGQLSHKPPPAWRCYSAQGASAAAQSIISGGVAAKNIAFNSPEQDIIAWLTDVSSTTPEAIGHRRWLLDPFLKNIAYGRVSGRIDSRHVSVGSALTLMADDSMPLAHDAPDIIAYPFHDYPARYFADGTMLSFSVLLDKTHKQGNVAVDFSQARITVQTPNSTTHRAKQVLFDNHYFGLPNNLQFSLSHIEPGLRYMVNIDGVRLQGVSKSYTYWFRIMPESDSNSLILQ